MFDDFAKLYSGDASWTITSTTANASVPAGSRKIALTVGCGLDYHFYMRHTDGKWSHKPAEDSITNLSFDSNEEITDNNITSVVTQGGYDDGVRYYLIEKKPIVDYPHNNGHYTNCLNTTTDFTDKAGDDFQHSYTIATGSKIGRIDYSNDKDFFMFVSPSSKSRTVTVTPINCTTSDFDLKIYSSDGTLINSDTSVGNPNITFYTTAGYRYFIEVYDYNNIKCKYTLNVSS